MGSTDVGFRRSDNKIVQGGLTFFEDLLVDAGETVEPGTVVVRSTDDQHVAEAGATATDALGVAALIMSERTSQTSREGQNVGSDLTEDDPVRVAYGVYLFRGYLAAGENVTKGQHFTTAAGGELQAATTGDPVYGSFGESIDNSGASSRTPILAVWNKGEVNL